MLTLLYKVIYFSKLKLNPMNSYINGHLHINNGLAVFGDNFRTRSGSFININEGKLTVGNNVFLNRNVSINCRVQVNIGSDVMFGENVCIYDHDHRFDNRELLIREQGYTSSSVVIGNNVWIGSNSVILKGVSIGNNSVIAAGSVVFSDIPENTIMYAKKTNVYKAIV